MRVLTISIVAAAATFAAQAQTYTLEPFQVVHPLYGPFNTNAMAVNNRGAVVGFLDFAKDHGRIPVIRGFKRDADGTFEYPITDPYDDAEFTSAQGINDMGTTVGRYTNSQGYHFHGFIESQRTFTTVDEGGGPNTWIMGINNRGDYVGAYGVETSPEHGFSRIGAKFQQIDVPGAQSTQAQAVAYDGTVVGCAGTLTAGVGFFRNPQGALTTFQVAGSVLTCGWGINSAAGTMVGYYEMAGNAYHGFVYNYRANGVPSGDIKVTTIDYPGAVLTWVTGVNDRGVIVGLPAPAAGPRELSFFGTP